MNYQTHTCQSGLRIIHLPSSSSVIYCGLAVKAGTRNELPGEEGIAHFCEHLSFKGTRRRTAVQIINALEGVGGELNAFTNKEDTVYYAATTRQHFRQAVDVLCDIVFCSQYPQHEVEKEREVVCDEIESYEDTPSELIFDEFENLLFRGHPLGHNILGTSQQVRLYNSEDAHRFTRRYYRPDNCIFFASGDIDFKQLVKMLEKAGCPKGSEGSENSEYSEYSDYSESSEYSEKLSSPIVRHRGTHQAHVMIGSKAFAADDPRRWPLFLLNNILGGPGLNSRLNLSLRERNGLVYTVESSMVTYSDTGAWSVYFGCDPHDVKRCCQLVRRELDHLIEKPLSEAQLKKAKQQIAGQLAIAADNREQFALDFAKNFLHQGKERDLNDILAHVDAITTADIQQAAAELFAPGRLLTLIYD
ncbi:MAG: insulinase family protein [Prevotella sp.]|nr:insulinase family protein [Prevotella sp.]